MISFTDNGLKIMRVGFICLLPLLICAVMPAQSQPYPPGIYACETADGNIITSDRPIHECLTREQRILGRSGATLAVIPPQLTPNQQAQREAELKRLEAERLRAEQLAASTRALLARYPTPASHDAARREQLIPLVGKMREAQDELQALETQQIKLSAQIGAYANPTEVPRELQRDYVFSQRDIDIQLRAISSLTAQIKTINDQFDQEYQALKPYWNQSPATASPSAAITP